ncbi:UBX domain-containing 7 [Paramuricea clavata]|uniref:UBX domain-containing 7 n=1 Tax=Paramuricea clavata TaxID=317549 RepID=A0A6S7JMZ7_PARCT|nr:UBX domain-containing 7 [Paramuricea clavata]
MAEHFILWQVYHDSDDGDRYIQFYHVTKFPHLAVLDPRTGEKLVEWETVDALSFCEVATEFLSNHSLGKESNGCFPPAAKRRKRESIIDASEDSQLEAAIAASLKETSTEAPPNSLRDKEYLDTPDEDSLTEFTDSETESEKPPKDTLGNDSVKNDNRTKTVKWEKNESKQKEKSVDDGTCLKKNETSQTKDVKRQDDDVDGKDSEGDDDNTLDPDCVKAYIMLRYPNGKRKQKTFPSEAAILDLIKYVQNQGYSNERYELVTNFPRKKLSYMDSDLSLKDAGLFPRETVFVQERLHES